MINNNALTIIINHLIINSGLLSNVGLCHGKLGIAVFFFNLSKYYNDDYYAKFGEIIFEDILEDINDGLNYNFSNGYSGIGWGILYLLENHFIAGDSNEILYEIDQKIMEWNINNLHDNSLMNGSSGVLQYVSYRKRCGVNICDKFDIECKEIEKVNPITLNNLVNECSFDINDNINQWKLGITSGCSGYGLKLIGL